LVIVMTKGEVNLIDCISLKAVDNLEKKVRKKKKKKIKKKKLT